MRAGGPCLRSAPAGEKPAEPDGPTTLEETLDWIKRYLPGKFSYQVTAGDGPRDVNVDYELLRFEGCQLEWRDQQDTLAVSLGDLDPLGVQVAPREKPDATFSAPVWNLSLSASGGKGAFAETKGDGSGAVNKYNGIDLQYNDRARRPAGARPATCDKTLWQQARVAVNHGGLRKN